jgi:hypothetical protein
MMSFRFIFTLLLVAVSFLSAFAADKNSQPKPAVISAKTVSFITFATGNEAGKLKQQATDFFFKWKRYQVTDDPTKADILVLLGPMPRRVSGDAFDAVLAGKPSPEPVDIAGAQAQFAVFDGAEVHGDVPVSGTLKPVWSTEMSGDDVKSAAKKYKQLVDNAQEDYDHMGLTFDKCRMAGLRCSH